MLALFAKLAAPFKQDLPFTQNPKTGTVKKALPNKFNMIYSRGLSDALQLKLITYQEWWRDRPYETRQPDQAIKVLNPASQLA